MPALRSETIRIPLLQSVFDSGWTVDDTPLSTARTLETILYRDLRTVVEMSNEASTPRLIVYTKERIARSLREEGGLGEIVYAQRHNPVFNITTYAGFVGPNKHYNARVWEREITF